MNASAALIEGRQAHKRGKALHDNPYSQVGEYAMAHAKAAYFEMGADPSIALARRLLAWLADERPPDFSARDAFHVLRGTVHTMDGMAEPLRLLTSHGYIRKSEGEHRGKGRPPSPRYEVNPYFYAHNAQNAQKASKLPDCVHSVPGGQRQSRVITRDF